MLNSRNTSCNSVNEYRSLCQVVMLPPARLRIESTASNVALPCAEMSGNSCVLATKSSTNACTDSAGDSVSPVPSSSRLMTHSVGLRMRDKKCSACPRLAMYKLRYLLTTFCCVDHVMAATLRLKASEDVSPVCASSGEGC